MKNEALEELLKSIERHIDVRNEGNRRYFNQFGSDVRTQRDDKKDD